MSFLRVQCLVYFSLVHHKTLKVSTENVLIPEVIYKYTSGIKYLSHQEVHKL